MNIKVALMPCNLYEDICKPKDILENVLKRYDL
jgi:hypothetical protein